MMKYINYRYCKASCTVKPQSPCTNVKSKFLATFVDFSLTTKRKLNTFITICNISRQKSMDLNIRYMYREYQSKIMAPSLNNTIVRSQYKVATFSTTSTVTTTNDTLTQVSTTSTNENIIPSPDTSNGYPVEAIPNDGLDDADDSLVLYERDLLHPDAMRTTTFMRSGFVFSSFHTIYWFWYTFDFIPHVNKAAMDVLHVDPMIGVAGIVFAMSLQSAFVLYPLRLISKLTYRIDEQRICVYTHRLPNMYPSVYRPSASFPLGTPNNAHNAEMIRNQQLLKPSSTEDIATLNEKAKTNAEQTMTKKVKYFTLDATTSTALNLIQGECQGDLSKYRGNLLIGPRWPKYVLDIKDSHEVKEPAYLLQALIKPENFYYKRSNRNKHNIYDESNVLSRKTMTPFQLRIKSRQQHFGKKSKQQKKRFR